MSKHEGDEPICNRDRNRERFYGWSKLPRTRLTKYRWTIFMYNLGIGSSVKIICQSKKKLSKNAPNAVHLGLLAVSFALSPCRGSNETVPIRPRPPTQYYNTTVTYSPYGTQPNNLEFAWQWIRSLLSVSVRARVAVQRHWAMLCARTTMYLGTSSSWTCEWLNEKILQGWVAAVTEMQSATLIIMHGWQSSRRRSLSC